MPTSDPFLDEVDSFLAGGAPAGPDPFLAEVDSFLGVGSPPAPTLDRPRPGVQLPPMAAAPDEPTGAGIYLRRPGEVFLTGPERPVARRDVATVTGRGPGVVETVARIPQRIAQGAVGGFTGTLGEQTAAAADVASRATGSGPAWRQAADQIPALQTELVQSGISAPFSGDPQWTNPQWWAAQAGQALGSAAALSVTAGAGSLAPALASTTESLAEASTVYNQLLAEGRPMPEALERAAATFASNMAVLGLTDVPLFRTGGAFLRRVLTKGALEGGQEVAQQGITNIATDRPLTEGMAEAGAVGTMAGGMFAAGPAGRGTVRPPIARPGEAAAAQFDRILPAPQEAPPVVATRSTPPPIPGTVGRPRSLPPTAAAPPVRPPITPPPTASVPALLPPVPPAENTGRTNPDSLRQAIERELGGAVTEEELARLAGSAEADMQRGREQLQGVRQVPDEAPAAPGPAPYRPGRDSFLASVDAFLGTETADTPDTADRPDTRPWLERVGEDAVASGFQGTAKEAAKEAERRARSLHGDTYGQAEAEGDDRALLSFIAKTGGIDVTDADLEGELKDLRTFIRGNSLGGVAGVLRHARERGPKDMRTVARSLDNVVAAIKAEPRFAGREIETPQQLLQVLEAAAIDHREGRQQRQTFDVERAGTAAGVRLGRRWFRSEGPMVRRSDTLDPEADAVQERFARAIEDDVEGLVARYRAEYGNVIDADRVKTLAGEDIETHHKALHAPSSWLADELYDRAVREEEPGMVVFTAGGPGAGKSSAIDQTALKDIAGAATILRDSALAQPLRAEEMLEAARANGHAAVAMFVYTDPVEAMARQAGRKRVVSLDFHLRAHRGALETMRRLAPQFDQVFIVNNSGERPELLEDRPAVDILEELAQNYPSDADIRARIRAQQAARPAAAPESGDRPASRPPEDARDREPDQGEPERPAGEAPPAVVTPPPSRRKAAKAPQPGRHTKAEIELGRRVARVEDTLAEDLRRKPKDRMNPRQRAGLEEELREMVAELDALEAARLAPPKVDTLDTGEQQPRLPGDVGAVREQEVKTAEFDAPFSLTGEAVVEKKPTEETLFEPTGRRGLTRPPAGRVISDNTRPDPDKPALPATSDNTGSPTRRVFSEPPPVPAHVKPPRKPLSEMQVVARLAEVFGHERRAGIFRKLQGKIPIPVATGVFGRPAFGYYSVKGQNIRLAKFGDLTTFAHELGHDIDHRIFASTEPTWDRMRKSKPIHAELKVLGKETSPPSADASYIRGEGIAEYFRIWFVDPALAKTKAPAFTAAFDGIRAGNRSLARQFDEGRILVQQYLAQDHVQRGEARIDFSTRSQEDPDGSTAWQKAQALFVDDLVALEDAVQHLADGQAIDTRANAYHIARRARGASAKAGGMLQFGIRDAAGQFSGGSLKAALEPVQGQLRAFSTYLVARRAVELRKRNIEPGMKAPEAEAILKKHDSPTFRAAARAVYRFQDQVLHQAVSAGLLTGEQFTQIRALNRNYVPYWRVFKPDGQLGTRRLAGQASLIKRIKGSGRDVVDPLQAIIRNTHALIEAAEQHRAMVAFVKQAQASTGGALFLEAIPTPQEATTFNLDKLQDEIAQALIDAGVPVEKAFNARTQQPALLVNDDALVDLNELVTVFTPATMATGKDRIISVMHGGKRAFFRVTDPALFEALTAIGPKATSQATRWAYKALGAPARALRVGATLTFGFVGRNIVRDSWVATYQSKEGFRPGYDTLRGLFSYLKADAHYQQFLHAGGGNAAMVTQDRKAIERELRQLTSRGRLRDHAASVVFHPIDFMRALSEASEHATRVGQFRRAREKGLSLEAAALTSRDVTVDFARGGSFAKEANQFIAFFNARIQGYVRFAETVRDNPRQAFIRATTTVTLLSLALWALNKDDPEYDELPEWEKNTYWHLPIHWLPQLFGGERATAHGGYLRIPKPFELGTLFGTVFERAMDSITERDPHAWKRLFVDDATAPASEVAAEAAKQGAWDTVAALVPTGLLPLMEAAMNYSTFRQRPIVSPFDKDLPAELQYNRWTSELAKTIGGALDMPPAILDHVIYSYGAGLARGVVSDAIDPALRQLLHGRDTPKAPTRPLQALPAVGAFVRDAAGTDAISISELYALRDRLRAVPQTVKRYQAEGNDAKAKAFAERFPDRLQQQRRVNAAAEDLKELRDRMSAIYAHEALTPDDKRELLDRTLEDMVNTARTGLGKPRLPSRFPQPLAPSLAARFRSRAR